MIFQDPTLIDYKTVIENISYAMEICNYAQETIGPRALELLDRVDILRKKDVLPKSLSGGEAQRVAIARALIHEPKFILADEPTAHLDKKNTHSIIDILKDINARGTTIVFATHDHDLIPLVPHARVYSI
jgi:cell division transport system ATP-binding protein